MKFTSIKSRKRAADASTPPATTSQSSGSVARPPAKKARAGEDKGPDKYCHFCQHAKQSMMACSSPGCNHRYCTYCLELHLQEQSINPNNKQWLCPTCRGSCCCCAEDGVCDKTHRHCKAFRYRARRALNAASKRASGPNKLGHNGGNLKKAQTVSSKARAVFTSSKAVILEAKATHVEEFAPSYAMLALLELAREHFSEPEAEEFSEQEPVEPSNADGASSEGEDASASRQATPDRTSEVQLGVRLHKKSPKLDALLETVSGMCAEEMACCPLEQGVASVRRALCPQQHQLLDISGKLSHTEAARPLSVSVS